MPCGNPTCRCKGDPPRLHGPYYLWTRKVAAKTVTVRLTAEQARRCMQWSRNMRQLDSLVRRLPAARAACRRRGARLGPVLIEAVAPSGASELPGLSIFAHSLSAERPVAPHEPEGSLRDRTIPWAPPLDREGQLLPLLGERGRGVAPPLRPPRRRTDRHHPRREPGPVRLARLRPRRRRRPVYGYKVRGPFDPAGLPVQRPEAADRPVREGASPARSSTRTTCCWPTTRATRRGTSPSTAGKPRPSSRRRSWWTTGSTGGGRAAVHPVRTDGDLRDPPEGIHRPPSSKVAHPGERTWASSIRSRTFSPRRERRRNLPVHEFHVEDFLRAKGLTNYWGYNTAAFFAPESSFGTGRRPECQVEEFKTLVREATARGSR